MAALVAMASPALIQVVKVEAAKVRLKVARSAMAACGAMELAAVATAREAREAVAQLAMVAAKVQAS